MELEFYKYQGTGNDFIILDNRKGAYNDLSESQVAFLCNRRLGIGADGLMLLNKHDMFDFDMKYFNADGREGSMCGNGGRCMISFAHTRGIIRSTYKFNAIDGTHEASINTDGSVNLRMNDVAQVKYDHGNFIVDTGSPHFVTMTQDIWQVDVVKKGREIRNSAPFKEQGINVNFVEQKGNGGKIMVRTYERGVEDETYSCGTGVTAAALVSFHNDNGFNHIDVKTRGGMLSVDYDKIGDKFENIWLTGPATKVYEGDIDLK